MKKNKTIAYMLAATLLVGGTFTGTKALFTDKVDTFGELKISTGDLDIEVVEDDKKIENYGKWVLTRSGQDKNFGSKIDPNNNVEISPKFFPGFPGFPSFPGSGSGNGNVYAENNDLNFDNLKPGDKLTKIVKIKNNGTLNANIDLLSQLDLDNDGKIELADGLITGTAILTQDEQNDSVFRPGEEATINITLTVVGEGAHGTNHNTDAQESTRIILKDLWTVEAEQLKNNPQSPEVQK